MRPARWVSRRDRNPDLGIDCKSYSDFDCTYNEFIILAEPEEGPGARVPIRPLDGNVDDEVIGQARSFYCTCS